MQSDLQVLILAYKYCIYPSLLTESNLEDLIENRQNANPGIYFIYAIPENPSATKKPLLSWTRDRHPMYK